jgi:CHASE3 domain sensor protein
MVNASQDTTAIYRRKDRQAAAVDDIDDNLADDLTDEYRQGWNEALDFAASLVKQDGDRQHAALIRRFVKRGDAE